MSDIVRIDGAPVGREPIPTTAQRPAEQPDPDDAMPSREKPVGIVDGPLLQSLPPGTALLRVSRRAHEGQNCFYLEMQSDTKFHGSMSTQDLRSQGCPDLTLADAVVKGAWWETFHALRSWSANKLTLRQWLTALRSQHGRQLRLIIWDETDFQIPWELFFHETENPHDLGWLGADIEVIRWTTIYSESPVDWSTGGPCTCHGSILSFTDRDFPSPEPLLSRYRHEAASSMQDLLTKLDDPGREIGLVHVWGHGTPGSNGGLAALAGMSMDRIGVYRMRALRKSLTVVLLNACGSAQLMHDDRFAEGATRSFAEIFLRRGARGVIATSGQVGKAESYDFAQQLLLGAEEAGTSLPSALRAYRATLADGLPNDPDDGPIMQEKLKMFFHGFMYLYFGHPDTALHMLPQRAHP